MNSTWSFPGKHCLEKLGLSLRVFTLLPALRDEQSTLLAPRWVYLVLLPSLGKDIELKPKIRQHYDCCTFLVLLNRPGQGVGEQEDFLWYSSLQNSLEMLPLICCPSSTGRPSPPTRQGRGNVDATRCWMLSGQQGEEA